MMNFFQEDNGNYSMTRLCAFAGLCISGTIGIGTTVGMLMGKATAGVIAAMMSLAMIYLSPLGAKVIQKGKEESK